MAGGVFKDPAEKWAKVKPDPLWPVTLLGGWGVQEMSGQPHLRSPETETLTPRVSPGHVARSVAAKSGPVSEGTLRSAQAGAFCSALGIRVARGGACCLRAKPLQASREHSGRRPAREAFSQGRTGLVGGLELWNSLRHPSCSL